MTAQPQKVLYDASGKIVYLSADLLDATQVSHSADANGATRFGPRRLALVNGTAVDPASHLASAITDGGSGAGIAFPLNGSWASSDWSGAYPYVRWSLDDLLGCPLGGALATPVLLQLYVRTTVPVVGDEVRVVAAIVNETDLTTATIDGVGMGILYSGGGNPAVEATKTANGSVTSTAGTGVAAIVGGFVCLSLRSIGATGTFAGSRVDPLDSSGVIIPSGSALSGTTSAVVSYGNPSRNYLVLAAGRTSAGNTNAFTIKADLYVGPMLRQPLLAA